jgi:hypothetical protein
MEESIELINKRWTNCGVRLYLQSSLCTPLRVALLQFLSILFFRQSFICSLVVAINQNGNKEVVDTGLGNGSWSPFVKQLFLLSWWLKFLQIFNFSHQRKNEERNRVNFLHLVCSSPHRKRCALTIIYKERSHMEGEEVKCWDDCSKGSFRGGCCELIVPVSEDFLILLFLPFL